MSEEGTMASTTSTDRLLALDAPQHASLSPDGLRLLLTTSRIEPEHNHEITNVSIVDVGSGLATPVHLAGEGHSPVWSPDGRAVAWTATIDGTATVMVAADLHAEGRELASIRGCTSSPVWSPDGTRLAVTMGRGTRLDRSMPYRWLRPIAAFDATGPLEDPPQVWVVEVATDQRRALTDDQWWWSAPEWSPDGTRLAATAGTDPEGRLRGQHLAVIHIAASPHGPQRLGLPRCRSMSVAWLPDGRLAALMAEPQADGLGSDAAVFIVDHPGSANEVVIRINRPFLHGDVYGDSPAVLAELYERVLLSDGTGRLVLRTGSRGRMAVERFHPDEPDSFEQLAGGDRCCSPVAAAGDLVIITSQSCDRPAELAVIEGRTQPERTLTDFGGSPAVDVHRFTVVTSDEVTLDGWRLTPHGAGLPLPTVLMVHGGPHFTFGEMFSLDAHALCAAGFAVLYTNPRGSTGYGTAFAQACHGDWAHGPAADLLAVVDHAIDAGWVDERRLGVMGNSYGGYMSAWLVGTTQRFAAAVIENPVTDLVSMYYTSDIGTTFFPGSFGGGPNELPDLYRSQSPITHAQECRTPCLFVVGEVDRRCPSAQAWAMHRVLHLQSVPSEMLVLPECSHEGSTYGPPVARRAADAAVVEWFQRWL